MAQQAIETKITPTEPVEGLRSLDVLVGKWNVTLEFKSDPANRGTGWESYEWMDGGFFLVGRFDRTFSKEKSHTGMTIFGADVTGKNCLGHFFDNQGNSRIYDVSLRDGVFKLTGKWERYSGQVSEDGTTISGTWEQSKDGIDWEYLCDITQTKAE